MLTLSRSEMKLPALADMAIAVSSVEHSYIAMGHLTNHDDVTLWYIASYVCSTVNF